MSRYANATMAELAAETIHVQNACNLSGVAASYVEVLARLRALGFGGDALALHPIARAWADKIASLTGIQGAAPSEVMDAHRAVDALANK